MKTAITVSIDLDLVQAMQRIKASSDVPVSAQVNRALRSALDHELGAAQ